MALTETALLGLACALTNAPQINPETILVNLSQEEKAIVQTMVEKGMCVPEKLELLLKQSKEQLDKGEAPHINAELGGQPTFRC